MHLYPVGPLSRTGWAAPCRAPRTSRLNRSLRSFRLCCRPWPGRGAWDRRPHGHFIDALREDYPSLSRLLLSTVLLSLNPLQRLVARIADLRTRVHLGELTQGRDHFL